MDTSSMTAADPRDGLSNDFLHGIVADEVASALLAIGIEAIPEGYLETIASEIVRRYMGGNALAHARPEAVDGWPDYVMLRDTNLYDDAGGLGQRIFTTAGAGYKKVKYIRADLAALTPERAP